MWEDVGIIRSAESLTRGLERLDGLGAELRATGIGDTDLAFNLTWHDWLNLENLIEMSKVVAAAALRRENSRGAHYPRRLHRRGRSGNIDVYRGAQAA